MQITMLCLARKQTESKLGRALTRRQQLLLTVRRSCSIIINLITIIPCPEVEMTMLNSKLVKGRIWPQPWRRSGLSLCYTKVRKLANTAPQGSEREFAPQVWNFQLHIVFFLTFSDLIVEREDGSYAIRLDFDGFKCNGFLESDAILHWAPTLGERVFTKFGAGRITDGAFVNLPCISYQ